MQVWALKMTALVLALNVVYARLTRVTIPAIKEKGGGTVTTLPKLCQIPVDHLAQVGD